MTKELSEYSKEISAQILVEYPEWEEYSGTDEYNGEVYFLIEVMPPSNNVENPMRVYTYQDELTVSFDAYHAHFYEFVEEDPAMKDDDASTFIKKIVNDSHAVVSYWHDEQWCGSTLLRKEEFPTDNEEYPYANIIKFRSWSGKLDKEIECESKE